MRGHRRATNPYAGRLSLLHAGKWLQHAPHLSSLGAFCQNDPTSPYIGCHDSHRFSQKKSVLFARRLLLTALLLLSGLSAARAQRTYYWKSHPENNNFHNFTNYTVGSPTGPDATLPPTADVDIIFPAESSITNITASVRADVHSITLPSEGTPYKFTFKSHLYITSNLTAYNNFYLSNYTNNTWVYFVDGDTAQESTIDMGTDVTTPTSVINIYVSKSKGGTLRPVNHNLEAYKFTVGSGRFASDGHNVVAQELSVERGTTFDTGATTITVNGTASFAQNNANVYNTAQTDLQLNGSTLNLRPFRAPGVNFPFRSVSFNNPKETFIITLIQGTLNTTGPVDLSIGENLYINTPLLTISNTINSSGKGLEPNYRNNLWFRALTARQAVINVPTEISIYNGNPQNHTALHLANGFSFGSTTCAQRSVLSSVALTTLTTDVAINTGSQLAYNHITAAGAGITADKGCDLGGNSGAITWQNESAGQDFYWIGGSGNWNDPGKWSHTSGGTALSATDCLPTTLDNVYFDDASFSAAGQTVTLDRSAAVKNLYWTDSGKRGTLKGLVPSQSLNINGDADFSGVAVKGFYPIVYFSGSGDQTITTAGDSVFMSQTLIFEGTGTYTLTAPLVSGPSYSYLLSGGYSFIDVRSGKFISAGHEIRIGGIRSRTTTERTIDLSGSDVYLNYYHSYTWSADAYREAGDMHSALTLYSAGLTHNFENTHLHLAAPEAVTAPFCNLRFKSFDDSYVWNLGDISFERTAGTFYLSCLRGTFNAQNVVCDANFIMNHGYDGTPQSRQSFKTLTLQRNSVNLIVSYAGLDLLEGFNTRTTECSELTITGGGKTSAHGVTLIRAHFPDFKAPGGIIKNIKADGTPLKAGGGIDNGGNENVLFTDAEPKVFYWVGNSGNWSDPTHWSVGVSGGDPAVTNPDGCLPRRADDVYFDARSFTQTGQKVTVDITPISIHSMYWTPEVNPYKPRLQSTLQIGLTLSGNLELAREMSVYMGGNTGFSMTGTGTGADKQTIQTHGLYISRLYALRIQGTGDFELLSDFNSAGGFGVSSGAGFTSNEHDIVCNGIGVAQGKGKQVDITNSRLISGHWENLSVSVEDCNLYKGEHVDISANRIYLASPCALGFHSIVFNEDLIASRGTVKADYIETKRLFFDETPTFTGTFETDTVAFYYHSGHKTTELANGTVLKVNKLVLTKATPCDMHYLQAVAGGTATISVPQNVIITFPYFVLKNLHGDTAAPAANYRVIGINAGGCENISFSEPVNSESKPDLHVPPGYTYTPELNGSITGVSWRRLDPDGTFKQVDEFRNLHAVTLTEPGYYYFMIGVKYAGDACEATLYQRILVRENLWVGGNGNNSEPIATGTGDPDATAYTNPKNWTYGLVPSVTQAPAQDVIFATRDNNPDFHPLYAAAVGRVGVVNTLQDLGFNNVPFGPARENCVVPATLNDAPFSARVRHLENLTPPDKRRALIVAPAASFNLSGRVIGYDRPEDASKLLIQAARSASDPTQPQAGAPGGSFTVHNDNPCQTQVWGTVELPALGGKQPVSQITDNLPGSPTWGQTLSDDGYAWQQVAIPFQEGFSAAAFAGGALQYYSEAFNRPTQYYFKWRNVPRGAALHSFTGYQLTQSAPKIYTLTGPLTFCDAQLTLTREAAEVQGHGADVPQDQAHWGLGQNVFGNSYTGAIQINALQFPPQAEQTVYLYTTGTGVERYNQASEQDVNGGAGSYTAVPVEAAEAMGITEIAPMQGFMIKFTPDETRFGADPVTMTIPYKEATDPEGSLGGLRSSDTLPQAPQEVLRLTLTDKSAGADVAWLIRQPLTSDAFNNGWDALKPTLHTSQTALYLRTDFGAAQVNTTDDLDGCGIAVKARPGSELTLSVHRQSTGFGTLYLADLTEHLTLEIPVGTPLHYSFTARQADELRFAVTAEESPDYEALKSGAATALTEADAAALSECREFALYTPAGVLVALSRGERTLGQVSTSLPQGAYIITFPGSRAARRLLIP